MCAASDPHEKYAYLFRLHQLVAEMISPKLDALLDLGANAIFIDKTWAEKHKVLLTPL